MKAATSSPPPSVEIDNWSPPVLADRVLGRAQPLGANNAAIAAASAALLGEFDCLTPLAQREIAALHRGAAVVRLAYQPNLFPYEQVHAQTVYLAELAAALDARGHRAVAIVLVVDYDASGEKRTRAARAFDPSRTKEQLRYFSNRIERSEEDVPSFLVPAPSEAARSKMADNLWGLARAFCVDPEHLLHHSGVHRPARSLADFNLFAWVNLTLSLWHLPVLFVRLSDLAPSFEMERRALAARVAAHLGLSVKDMLWRLCGSCGKRLGGSSDCCQPGSFHPWSVPKVLIDNLSDYTIYGISGGTNYANARNHLLEAHGVADAIGLAVPPEACWRIEAAHLQGSADYARADRPQAQALLSKGHNSMLEHILDETRAAAFLERMRQCVAASTR